jgi:uncharacterized protein
MGVCWATPSAGPSSRLTEAVQSNQLAIVDLLLDAGAKVDAATRYKITQLSIAALNGSAPMVERLLKAGADANGVS